MEVAYRILAEQASELVCRHARDSTFRYLSPACRHLLGQHSEQLLGTEALALVDPVDRGQVRAVLLALLSGYSQQARFLAHYLRPDGKTVCLDVTAYPVRGEPDGRIEEYVTVAREATHEARQGAELSRQQRRMARMTSLLDAVPGMIYQWTVREDGTREFTYCNQWPLQVLGVDPSDLSTLDVRLGERVHPDDLKAARAAWLAARGTLSPWSWRGRLFARPGEVMHVVVHARPDRQPDGNVLWSGVLLDDSRQRQAEDALLHSNELFGTVVANMEVAHVRLDLEGEVVEVNAAGVQLFGAAHGSELIGKSAARDLWLSPSRFEELRSLVMRDGVALVDAPLRTRDGRVRIGQGALRLQRDLSGVGTAIDVVLRDVSDERKASDELVQAREAAETGNRARSAFLASMSHEIRTPMNTILGLSQLALEAEPTPRQRQYLTQIRTAGETLLDTINDVLDVSKIEAGKIQLDHAPFELDRMLESVASVIAVRAAERKVELIFAVDPTVPDMLVGDRTRLGQVITNLVSHAVKHKSDGEVVISVELLTRAQQRATLRFSIRDSGNDTSLEQTSGLLVPFSQVEGRASEQTLDGSLSTEPGAVLGLTLSQELVHLMGGQIEVESAPGRSSDFRFELTLDVDDSLARPRAKLPRDMNELRVLVVDDSQVARDVLTRSLLAMGSAVCAVPSAKAALETLTEAEQRGTPYQLALIDVRMSETDGIELASRIKQSARLTQKPELVMISASSRDELVAGRDLSDVRAFLRKPISRSTLFDTLIEIVNRHLLEKPVQALEPQTATLARPSSPATATTDAGAKKKPLSGLTVMVVEDNEINQILARDLLESAGAEIVLASDGREALRLAAERTPGFDVIMMDVQMPGMDGHATTRALRLEAKTANTPIIAMTAHAFDAERNKCLASGMNAHVSKPINPRELVQTIQMWARGGRDPSAPVTGTLAAPPRKASRNEASFDANALSTVFKDPAKQLAFLRKFIDAARKAMHELEPAWKSRDAAQVSFVGHKLKSSAKACGANRLAVVFTDFEQLSKTSSWNELEKRRGEVAPLLAEIERHVEGPQVGDASGH